MPYTLRVCGRMVAAGVLAAVQRGSEAGLQRLGVMVIPTEDVPPDPEPEADPAPDPATALTGLDAERWVNGLRGDYHAADAVLDVVPCGPHDCRWCWANATGATG